MKKLLFCRLLALSAGAFLASRAEAYLVSTDYGYELKWAVPNMALAINPALAPAGATAAIQAAMNTWSTVSGSAFRFTYSGTATRSGEARDSQNVCSFVNQGATGMLAYNSYWYDSLGRMEESDVVVNTFYAWSMTGEANKFDLQSIMTHELGHSLSLRDLYSTADADKTMYGRSRAGDIGLRSLHADDMAGIVHLYPGEGVPPAPGTGGPGTGDPVPVDPVNPALTTAGSYDGYLYSGSAASLRGTFSLTVGNVAGRLTAKAAMQKRVLTFRASAWAAEQPDGTRAAVLTARGGETLSLAVRQNRAWGSLAGGTLGEALEFDSARNRFKVSTDVQAKTALNSFLGYYTAALPVAQALSLGTAQAAPGGSGYIALTVGGGGSVKIAGMLADGTRVTQASRLILSDLAETQACVPFFVPVNSKQGSIGGLLWIDRTKRTLATDTEAGWFVRWEYPGAGPNGFSETLDVVGGYFSPIPSLAAHYRFSANVGAADYHYAGGAAGVQESALPDQVGVSVNGLRLEMAKGASPVLANGAYDYAAENAAGATITFAARTGIFKGRFNLYFDYDGNGAPVHKTVKVAYAGILTPVREAVFADEPAGQGYCLVPDNDPALLAYRVKRSYSVWLHAAP